MGYETKGWKERNRKRERERERERESLKHVEWKIRFYERLTERKKKKGRVESFVRKV